MAPAGEGESQVTVTEAKAAPAPALPAQAALPQIKTNPYIGTLGVFLGAGVATLNARLISIGLADIRGARGFGFDEASWIPTVLDMAMMFSGVFCVFLNSRLGPRRILLPCAAFFTIASILLPLSPNISVVFALLVLAGLTSGTFYSLTLTFALIALPRRLVIFGIAAYAGDIVFDSNMASALQGWYAEHLSWHWIFWTAAIVTPLMMICVYFGIPRRSVPAEPGPSWRGFTYFSLGLALLTGAMDQGERLDWLHSGVIVGMGTAGLFLLAATWVRRKLQPNTIANLEFLKTRNTIILASAIFVFRFTLLAGYVLVPGFLGNIQHYRAIQTGQALAWVAAPQLFIVWLVAVIIIFTNSRLVLAVGLTVTSVACWICAHVDSSWAGTSFEAIELALAVGFACSYIGMVGSIVLEALEGGALTKPANIATFSGLMHFTRIFGGSVGVAIMTRLITVRERFHSNLLGLHVQAGSWLTDERLRMLTGGLFPVSTGSPEAQHRAIDILSQQVRGQAYTQAISDGFLAIGWISAAFLLVMLTMRPIKLSYKDLRNM
jgi:MFS transporter, DHA2 family, multidrug resistance protein